VAPRSFYGMVPGRWSDFYVPACWMPRILSDFERETPLTSDRFWWLQLIIRPKPGTTPAGVQAALGTQFAAMVKPRITEPKQHATFGLRPGAQGYAFEQQDSVKPLLILAALVGLVLLTACSNVANLLLARAAARRREAAMRLALGAGRLRLVRQHLTEGLVLALLSGAAGFVFARWFAVAVVRLAPERSALVLDLAVTWREVAFAAGLSVAAGLLVGIVPAISLARSAVSASLRAGTTVRAGWRQRFGLGRPLVAVQIALSLLLLVVAGLFVRSLGNLQAIPLGLNPDGIVLFNLDPSAAGFTPERKEMATQRIGERLRRVPGVTAVTWSSFALLDNFSWNTRVSVPGEAVVKRPPCNLLWTGPAFHQMLEIPLVAGRLFDDRDGRTAPRVAVVNETFVKTYLKGAAPLGRIVTFDLQPEPRDIEIVGVVRDSKYARVRQETRPIAFFPEAQQRLPVGPVFALKVSGDAAGRGARTRADAAGDSDPHLPRPGESAAVDGAQPLVAVCGVRRGRPSACGGGTVRRRGVRGDATDGRNGRAAGARREPVGRAAAGDGGQRESDRARRVRGARGRAGRHARPQVTALRADADRSADAGRRGGAPDRGRRDRRLRPGVARGGHQRGGGAQVRIGTAPGFGPPAVLASGCRRPDSAESQEPGAGSREPFRC
jgi:predicted permease